MKEFVLIGLDAVTMNNDREIIIDAAIAVSGSKIKAIGKRETVVENFHYPKIDRTGSGKRMIALPGFTQTHVHTSQSLGRGLADDCDLITWTRKRIWPYEAALSEEDVYVSALLSMAELIKSGTTTFAEAAGEHPSAIGRAIIDSGIKGIITLSTMDLPGEIPEALRMTTEEAIERNLALVESWEDRHPRVRAGCNILNNFLCSEKLWIELSDLALSHHTILECHLAESPSEVEFVLEKTGKRPIEYLYDLGVLGPHIIGAHVVYPTEKELDMLQECDLKVAHCPSAGLRLCGIAPIPQMLERNINVSLGTNSPPCSNRNSLFDEMWLAAMMHKGVEQNPEIVPGYQVLEMATINGAAALGRSEQTGSLEADKTADIVLLNLNQLPTTPTNELISTLIYQATAACVDTVYVNGEAVLEEGALKTIDEEWLIGEAERRARDIVHRADIRVPSPWPVV